MPSPHTGELIPIGRKGQMNPKPGNLIYLENHRPIVTRRRGIKEADQQRLTQTSIEIDPAIEVPFMGLSTRENDQCTHSARGQSKNRPNKSPFNFRRRMRRLATKGPNRDDLKHATQIILKNNHQHDGHRREKTLKQAGCQFEIQRVSEAKKACDRRQTDERQARSGGSQPGNAKPDQHGRNGDVEHVARAKFPQ